MLMDQRALISGLCWILNVISSIKGLYLLEVRLNGYNNQFGRCQGCVPVQTPNQMGCCDRHNTTECGTQFLCDTYFDYCLRPLGSEEERGECSNFGHNIISTSNRDDSFIDFSQSTVLSLDNPLILPGLTSDWNGVQLFINAMDNDTNLGNPDDLVDTLLINHSLPIEESVRQNFTGIYGFLTMDLTIRAVCAENFTGADCTQLVYISTNPPFTSTNREGTSEDLQTKEVPVGIIAGTVISVFFLVTVSIMAVLIIIRARSCHHQPQDPRDDSEESSFKMESNVIYETSMETTGLDTRENDAYAALSELRESFEMSNSICYAATEPRNLYATVNTSYGCLSVSGESNVRS